MKFLIYGADGWIGGCLKDIVQSAGDTVVLGQRVTSLDSITKDLSQHQPDRVICSVGRTYGPGNATIDYLEAPGKLLDNVSANLTAPVLIAAAAAPIPTLYIGSGCIFEYDDEHPLGGKGFSEADYPNFFGSSYSVIKGQTDMIMRALPHVLCARIRMPISDEKYPRDFITKIIGYQKICSIPNSMTILSDWLPFLVGCLVAKKSGTINAVNPGTVEHKRILSLYEAAFERKHAYELMTATEQNGLLLARRSNNYLETEKSAEWMKDLDSDVKQKYGIPSEFLPIEERIEQILKSRAAHEVKLQTKIILVTGGAGFIGSNFINFWMKKFPHDMIVNFDCLEPHSNAKNVENSKSEHYKFIHGNLVDKQCLTEVFQRFPFTHIVHFAASSNVDSSFIDPVNCTISNTLGTHMLLEEARHCQSLRLFLLISTDEVYGEMASGRDALENETTFWPTNPYAASKAAAECLVMAYGKSFKVPWIITRANNVYGRYQYPAQAIPKFISCLLSDQKMPVHGAGHVQRKFLHVMDKCEAIETLIEKGGLGEVYNIGAPDEMSVLELCGSILEEVLGTGHNLADWTVHVKDRCYNDCRYSVDSTKLEQLGWKPKILFQDGLKDTVDWYASHRNHWSRYSHMTQLDDSGQTNRESDILNALGYNIIVPVELKDMDEDDEVPAIHAEVTYS